MKYKVNVGINWYGGKRAEPGEIRSDIPKKSLPWLLEQGIVSEYDPKAETATGAATGPAGQESTAESGGETAGGGA